MEVFLQLPFNETYCHLLHLLQLREYKRERKISNDKLEDESEELRKIKKVSLSTSW